MANLEPRDSQGQATDAPATTPGVLDGVAAIVSEVDSTDNLVSDLDIPSVSIAYSPADLGSQRASPFEVAKYLKHEMGLEARTASLTLDEQNRAFQHQQEPLPSTSSQDFYTLHFSRREYSSVFL